VGFASVCLAWIGPAPVHALSTQCRIGILEGEVSAGQSFTRPIGKGLELMLEPLSSGWIIRVLPVNQPRPSHDYAELATPPYHSVNPLLISTDYSFRAQDAAGWTPRRFRFAPSQQYFAKILSAYTEYERRGSPSSSQDVLANLVSQSPEATLTILDIHLVPGIGNQVPAAAVVAQNFAATVHTVEKAPEGQASALGKLTWMQFRIALQLPREFQTDSHLKTQPCNQK
jgi:hypothetical protein